MGAPTYERIVSYADPDIRRHRLTFRLEQEIDRAPCRIAKGFVVALSLTDHDIRLAVEFKKIRGNLPQDQPGRGAPCRYNSCVMIQSQVSLLPKPASTCIERIPSEPS